MGTAAHRRGFPADLALAGEARHFVAWLGAAAGLRGGALSELAVAAEAVLTDIFLSTDGGALEIGRKRPCTKITSDYEKRWFVQNQTTISSVRPRLLVQSRRKPRGTR